jgi:hypothetical protein
MIKIVRGVALCATVAIVWPATARAQFAVQPAIMMGVVNGGSFATGLSGPGAEVLALYHTFLFDFAIGGQYVDYGRVNAMGLIIEPRLLLPDTERVKPYLGLRAIREWYSYPHQLGTAKGTGAIYSVGFGVNFVFTPRISIEGTYHYIARARFGGAKVDGTDVDGSPIQGSGGGIQLRGAVSIQFGKR